MQQSSPLYLGVEGGASKSEAVLVDENNTIIAQGQGQALNYHSIGASEFKNNLSALLTAILPQDCSNITAVLGLAGVDTPHDESLYTMAASSVLPQTMTYKVMNEAIISLWAKCPDATKRILVICGTGSSAYGENGEAHAKSLGWGHVLGDEGSGYAIGKAVLKAATQSYDGRIEKTVLQQLVLKQSNAQNFDEFYTLVYSQKPVSEKFFIASYAPLLDKAIEQNDLKAIAIRQETASELARGVIAVAKRLEMEEDEFCLGFVGSGWKMIGLQAMVIEEVKKICPKFIISSKQLRGVWGAISMAKQLHRLQNLTQDNL